MRRLARRLFALCSAVSLAVFLVVWLLWLSSGGRWGHLVTRQRPHPGGVGFTMFAASSHSGSLALSYTRNDADQLVRPGWRYRRDGGLAG